MKRLRLLQDHFYLSISIVLRALRLHLAFEILVLVSCFDSLLF